MLAQSFKTATELDLTAEQLSALIEVLAMLETDQLKHDMNMAINEIPPGEHLFNMAKWHSEYPNCGTVSCIAGTACFISGNSEMFRASDFDPDVGLLRKSDTPLGRLFYPDVESYRTITVEQAATALRSFLTTGDVDWPRITNRPINRNRARRLNPWV